MNKFLWIAVLAVGLPLGAMAQDPEQETGLVETADDVATEAVAEVTPEPVVEEAPPPSAARFLDAVKWQLMASGYYMFNAHRVSGSYNGAGYDGSPYPYTRNHGFGLNFAGADASYEGDEWGDHRGLALRHGCYRSPWWQPGCGWHVST